VFRFDIKDATWTTASVGIAVFDRGRFGFEGRVEPRGIAKRALQIAAQNSCGLPPASATAQLVTLWTKASNSRVASVHSENIGSSGGSNGVGSGRSACGEQRPEPDTVCGRISPLSSVVPALIKSMRIRGAAVMTDRILNADLRRTVLIVPLLNLAYFGVEFIVALSIGSVSLFVDSVDFLEDASVNLLIFYALAVSNHSRPRGHGVGWNPARARSGIALGFVEQIHQPSAARALCTVHHWWRRITGQSPAPSCWHSSALIVEV